MKIETYKKAEAIHDRLREYRKLRSICSGVYKRHIFTRKLLWLSDYREDEIVLCDNELTEIIRDYCEKKINELEKQLEAL